MRRVSVKGTICIIVLVKPRFYSYTARATKILDLLTETLLTKYIVIWSEDIKQLSGNCKVRTKDSVLAEI